MTRFTVTFTELARADLREIREHLRDVGGLPLARRWADRLTDAAKSLALFPDRAEGWPDLAGARRLVVTPYLIVYRREDRRVRILRIVYGSRDRTALTFDPA